MAFSTIFVILIQVLLFVSLVHANRKSMKPCSITIRQFTARGRELYFQVCL